MLKPIYLFPLSLLALTLAPTKTSALTRSSSDATYTPRSFDEYGEGEYEEAGYHILSRI
jgi:hypothetical protein